MNAGEVYIFIEVEVAKALGAINKIEMALDKLNSKSFKGIGQQISGIDKSFSNLSSRIKNFSTAASQSFSSIEKTLKNVGTKGLGSVGKEISSADKAFGNIISTLKNLDTASTTSVGGMNSKLKDTGKTLSTFGRLFGKLQGHLSHFNSSVWNVYTSVKDIFRVATGILMSQFIYRGILTPIRESITSLWEFNQLLETTHVSLGYFLKDSRNIKAFSDAMEDMAAKTPYQFKDVVSAARMFFRYGFSEKQVLPMVQIIADMGAATGATTDQINHLAMALGQVKAKGRLVAEEARRQIGQILPIDEILKDKLGITAEDLGDVYVSAKEGLTAIFEWVRDNYEDAAYKMEQTTQGLISSIKDNLLFIGQELSAGLFGRLREYLTIVRDKVYDARKALKESGIEAMLLELFPKDMALAVYQLIYVFRELGRSVAQLWHIMGPLRHELARVFLILAKIATSSLMVFLRVIEGVARAAFQSTPIIRTLTGAIIGIIAALAAAQALVSLAGALGAVSKFIALFLPGGLKAVKVLYLIAGAIGLVIGLLSAIPKVRQAISNFGNKFAGVFGIQIPDSINAAKAAMAGVTYDVDFSDIEEGFEDVEEGMDGVGDAAGKAAKEINDKFLASFDEVYEIPDKLDDLGLDDLGGIGGGGIDIPELDVPPIGDIGGIGAALDNLLPKLDAFKFSWAELKDILIATGKYLWESLKTSLVMIWDLLVYTYTDIFPKIYESLWTGLPTIIEIIFKFIGVLITSIAAIVSPLLTTVVGILTQVITTIIGFYAGVWVPFVVKHYKEIWQTIYWALTLINARLMEQIANIELAIFAAILNIIGTVVAVVLQLGTVVVSALVYIGKMWWSTTSSLGELLWIGLKTAFEIAKNRVVNFIPSFGTFLLEAINGAWDIMFKRATPMEVSKKLGNMIIGTITDGEAEIRQKAGEAAKEVIIETYEKMTDPALLEGFAGWNDWASKTAAKITSGMSKGVAEAHRDAQKQITEKFASIYSVLEAKLAETGQPLMEQFGKDVAAWWEAGQKEGWEVTIDNIKTQWGTAFDTLSPLWVGFFADTQTSVKDWWDEDGKSIWEGTGTDIQEIMNKWLTSSQEDFQEYWEEIQAIHKKYGDDLESENKTRWQRINEAVVESLDVTDETLPPKLALIEKRFHNSYDEIQKTTENSMGLVSGSIVAAAKNADKNLKTEMDKVEYTFGTSLFSMETATNTSVSNISNSFIFGLEDANTQIGTKFKTIDTTFGNAYLGLEDKTTDTMFNISGTIVDTLDKTEEPAVWEVKEIQEGIVEEFIKSEEPLKESIQRWDDIILDEKEKTIKAAKEVAEEAVKAMDKIFKNFHPEVNVKVNIPEIKAPTVTAKVNMPTVPSFIGTGKVTSFQAQHGAVVYKDQMIRVGEHNTTEMIAPLNESSLAPFARMIASLIGDRPVTDTPNVANDYVIVPLDRRGMINLERELFMIRKSEGKRRADY